MFPETDATRLGMLQACGESVQSERGTLWCMFDRPDVTSGFVGEDVRTNAARLMIRTSDVAALRLARDQTITRGNEFYSIRDFADQGDGFTFVFLGR
jgi:hypothetical protein